MTSEESVQKITSALEVFLQACSDAQLSMSGFLWSNEKRILMHVSDMPELAQDNSGFITMLVHNRLSAQWVAELTKHKGSAPDIAKINPVLPDYDKDAVN